MNDILQKASVADLERIIAAKRQAGIDPDTAAIIRAALAASDDPALLVDVERATAAAKARRGGSTRGYHPVGEETVYAPLPTTHWLCEALHLGPGRPAMLAGYGYSGKSMVAQSLALSVMTRRPIWGWFRPSRQGHVLHIDHEQGEYATYKRYQRLTRGMGIDRREIDGRMHIDPNPEVYLTEPDAESLLMKACEGMDLCIIDSLRAATPGVDENDSKVRQYLDILQRVSRKQGTTFLVIHHAGKGQQSRQGASDDPEADLRKILRGSSAIFDACGCVLVMTAAKGEDAAKKPKRICQAKGAAESECDEVESFYVEFENDPSDGKPRAGVRIVYKTNEQVNPPKDARDVLEENVRRVVDVVKHSGVKGIPSKAELRALAHIGKNPCDEAVDTAVGRRLIKPVREGKHTAYVLGASHYGMTDSPAS